MDREKEKSEGSKGRKEEMKRDREIERDKERRRVE